MVTHSNHFHISPSLPKWLQDLKQENWDRFNALPPPKRKDEAWRFARFNNLNLEDYQWARPNPPAYAQTMKDCSDAFKEVDGKIVLADDHTLGNPILSEKLREQGVIFCSLEKAFEEQDALLRKYFVAEKIDQGSKKFHSFHTAFMRNGVLLYVPRGVTIELPLTALHWACADSSALLPQTLIIAEEESKVTLTELYLSVDNQIKNFICSSAYIYASAGATVTYQALQNWNEKSHCFQLNTVDAEKDAHIRTINLNIGAQSMRHEHHSRALGSGSNIETYSLGIPHLNQEIDQRTLQTHYAPHTRSDLLFKNALMDDARAVFSGLIQVEEKAQQTDAYQTNRNLLLSDSAEANALPGLEIKANDVKCSHGATTGHLDESEIFYFLARGIPKAVAQQLLAFGFFEEILEKVECETLVDKTRALIQKKLNR